MKRIYLVMLMVAVLQISFAQNTPDQEAYEAQVNTMVWKPFKQTYEARDWKGFNELHTEDVLRVHDGGIQIGESYKNSIKESYQKKVGYKVTIDFAMERRMQEGNVAYEVGFYRVIYDIPNQEPRSSYGRFHVVLNKVSGQWKIAQDWDSNSFNGRPIDKADFEKAQFLDLE